MVIVVILGSGDGVDSGDGGDSGDSGDSTETADSGSCSRNRKSSGGNRKTRHTNGTTLQQVTG